MNVLVEQFIQCPYCWEKIEVLIDQSESEQHYIEDCQVCCKPIVFDVTCTLEGEMCVNALSEND